MFGRRTTIAGTAAATFAAASIAPMPINASQARTISSGGGLNSCGPEKVAQDPSGQKIEAARKWMREQKDAPRPVMSIDMSIESLKSVSPQHKAHMHLAESIRKQREYESWQTSVLRMFGLKDEERYRLF